MRFAMPMLYGVWGKTPVFAGALGSDRTMVGMRRFGLSAVFLRASG